MKNPSVDQACMHALTLQHAPACTPQIENLIDHLHNYWPGLETRHPVTVGQSPAHDSHSEQSETETRKTAFCSSETLKSYAGDWLTVTGCPVSNPGNNCANGLLKWCEQELHVKGNLDQSIVHYSKVCEGMHSNFTNFRQTTKDHVQAKAK